MEEIKVLAGQLEGRGQSLDIGHRRHLSPQALPVSLDAAAFQALTDLIRLWLQAPLPRRNPTFRALRGGLNAPCSGNPVVAKDISSMLTEAPRG